MKKVLLFISLILAAILFAGCLNVAMYTKVDQSGNISNLKLEINTTSSIYGLMTENIQKQGYSTMKDYILSNYSRTLDGGASGNTVDYDEEWSGDRVKMIIDIKGSIKPPENSGIKIAREGDYLIYELSTSGDAAGQYPADSAYSNLSDAMLSAVTFDYYLEMPGKIVDSNATVVKDNKAEWHFNGKTMASMSSLYAKSEVPKAPGFETVAALLAVLAGCGMAARTGKNE